MQRNVLEYLEQSILKVPNKVAYIGDNEEKTFEEVYQESRAIGSFLYEKNHYKEPIVVFMGKQPRTIVTFYGVIYSGNYYVPIDEEMPKHRIELIFQKLNPKAVICDDETSSLLASYGYKGDVYLYHEMIKTKAREDIINSIRDKQLDTDPIYIVFTSGSTGVPKGVVACHRSVIDYIENLSEVLRFNENTVFGNQTPLYVEIGRAHV